MPAADPSGDSLLAAPRRPAQWLNDRLDALTAEWTDSVAYPTPWGWYAAAAVLLVAAYYAASLWWTRRRPGRPAALSPDDLRPAQWHHLAALDRLEQAVRAGELPAREAHQRMSEVVRSFAQAVSPVPARSMTLTDLRAAGVQPLAEAVALLYPPEFAPEAQGRAEERFDAALHEARRVVTTWR